MRSREEGSQSDLLAVKDLRVKFSVDGMVVRAVDGVSLRIERGEVLALIGESGSGKSVLGSAIAGLLPKNAVVSGEVLFRGKNLLELPEKEMEKIRGREIAWIPQNPSTSLNPVMKIGMQVAEPMEIHFGIGRGKALSKVVGLLRFFGVVPAEERVGNYPHQMSGGMRQRVLVAMGTSTKPLLIIADEPTKGIDATRRRKVAEIFERIADESVAILLITHDIAFAEKLATRVGVMYCGQLVELRKAGDFFDNPLHPYSQALLNSLPSRGLKPVKGYPPSAVSPPEGCRFHPRCDAVTRACKKAPPIVEVEGGYVRCWLYAD